MQATHSNMHILTLGIVPELFCELLWLPSSADVELVRMRLETGGRRSGGMELLLK